jgi:hypothetical protein
MSVIKLAPSGAAEETKSINFYVYLDPSVIVDKLSKVASSKE